MLLALLCLIACVGLLGCPSSGHLHLYQSKNIYEEAPSQGAIGRLKGSGGNCPTSGVAPGWCTGGEFTAGVEDGMFGTVGHMDVDLKNGFFYLADSLNNRVVKYDLSGNFVGAIGALANSTGSCPASGAASGWCTGGEFDSGVEDGMFLHPTAVAVDVDHDRFYVTDAFTPSPRIQVFELSSGNFIGAIGGLVGSTGTCPSSGVASGWCTGGEFYPTQGDGGFYAPVALAVDSAKELLYVLDSSLGKVQKFDAQTGEFLGAIGGLSGTTGTCVGSGAASGWCTGGQFTQGALDGEFFSAADLSIDPVRDRLYVADSLNHRVQKFILSTGEFLGALGSSSNSWKRGFLFQPGSDDGMFNSPQGLSLDVKDNILYVSDTSNHRLQRFNAQTGEFLGAYGKTKDSQGTCPSSGATQSWCTGGDFIRGAADGELSFPQDIQVVPEEQALFITDQGNNRVQKIFVLK